jgi:hypothetical protein
VGCDRCAIDCEPGRFYDTEDQAREVRDRMVQFNAWLLTAGGELVCPECAATP